jgi:hypothetical protein
MAKILVTYAGSAATADAASQVAAVLRGAGHRVTLADCDAARDAWHYDAVVVGSDLHGHHQWCRAAVSYLQAQAPDLAERPTFLFECPRRPSAGTTTPHKVRVLAYEIGTSAPTSFAPVGDTDTRRVAIEAWSRRIDAALRSPVDGLPTGHWVPAEATVGS